MIGYAAPESRFSVIVPTLNEEAEVGTAIRSATVALGTRVEVIVADGGSHDGTVDVAEPLARVIRCPPGRGRQLHAGATSARGEILVFLHADTELSPDTGERILDALEDPEVVGGCCRLHVRRNGRSSIRYALLERGIDLRTRWLHTATGDQVIFVRRDAYQLAGGFPDLPLFEDVALVRCLRGLGRFVPVDALATTSARRWESAGFMRTVTKHWLLRAAYLARVPPERLARWYGLSPRP